MHLKVDFSMDNAAFEAYPEQEAARILRVIAERIESGYCSGAPVDINGNSVGSWDIDTTSDTFDEREA